MIYAVFLLVLAEILINWLYKSKDLRRNVIMNVLYGAIIICSTIGLCFKTSVFLYIYYALLIALNLAKLSLADFMTKLYAKSEQGTLKLEKARNTIQIISIYLSVLLTITAMCIVWQKVTYILIAIVMLLVLIMVHEFGHYIAGKILKFKINEFSVGFGPAILQKTKKDGEKISLRVLPLGGYCAFEGEDEDNPHPEAFNNQKPWKRLIVLFAGVFANFIFGIITSVIYLSMASYSLPKVIMLADGNTNPFMVGDIIVAVDDNKIDYYKVSSDSFAQFSKMVSKYDENEEFVVTVIRNGEEVDLTVKKEYRPASRYITNLSGLEGKLYLKQDENTYSLIEKDNLESYIKNMDNKLDNLYKLEETSEGDNYVLYEKSEVLSLGGITESSAGASLGILQTYHYERYSFGEALLYAVPFGVDICWLILKVLGGIFTGATKVADLGGTVTSVDAIAELTSVDFRYLLYLFPMIAMNLAVFNILPIPALDGSKMVFVLIEMIRRKPINRNVEAYIHFIGLLALLALVIFLDVYHFFIL